MELQARQKFAQCVAELRAGRSYRAFAKFIGVSHPTIKSWENLEGVPDQESVEKIAVLRGESLQEFREFLSGKREPSQLQKLIQQIQAASDHDLAVILKTIADRIENS